jgi:hypothetical protein
MDDALRTNAVDILGRLPLSLEMPAGTGKTQLVAAIAAVAWESNRRTLVLTHTHAGVDAIRRRLKLLGVPARTVQIATITGWAFDLVRSYPLIAEVQVPEIPDWTRSPEYVAGAVRVARSKAISYMHAVSFDYFIVDEYQDCNENQHELVLAIADAIPKTCLLGDRLQGIFGFGGEKLVDWDAHVVERFPLHPQEHKAWRWQGHNEELGKWLLEIRPGLLNREPLDLSTVCVSGFEWKSPDPTAITAAALQSRPDGESVLVLGQWAPDVNDLARKLQGVYGVMEELQGKFMVEFLDSIDNAQSSDYAYLLAKFAKECFSGASRLDRALLDKLKSGHTVSYLKRDGLEAVQAALDELVLDPSLTGISVAMSSIAVAPGLRVFKREAWFDTRKAIDDATVGDGVTAVDALGRIRDALRHSGRRPAKRVVSRTLLVKGLEYDHVIVANADGLTDYRNLYVALTRGRKTLTVFSRSSRIGF